MTILISAITGIICGAIGYKIGKSRQTNIIYQSVPMQDIYEANDMDVVPPVSRITPSRSSGRIK